MNQYLKLISELYGVNITNRSKHGFLLFDCGGKQLFDFGLRICFKGIKNKEEFRLNVPVVNVEADKIIDFHRSIMRATYVTSVLNKYLEKYKQEVA